MNYSRAQLHPRDFPQLTKKKVRSRAWFACCVCKKISMGLEIHHIQPKAEGGINTEDNAAPLCPSCHRSFGGNQELRSRIREMRDDWYKKCEVLFTKESRPNEVFNSIYDTFSVEELERLTVHNPVYVLGTEATGFGAIFRLIAMKRKHWLSAGMQK